MFISKLNFKYILLTVLMAILAVFLRKYRLENLSFDSRKADRVVLYSDELAKYNGVDIDKLYLSVIGSIFDVTDGKTHYANGSPYHYFVGKNFHFSCHRKLNCNNYIMFLLIKQFIIFKYLYLSFL